MGKYEDRLIGYFRTRPVTNYLRRLTFPGFGGVPITEVIKFFYSQLISEAIVLRSSATAYSFILALFPGLIVLFSLIPYFPIASMHEEVLAMMEQIMPSSAFQTIESTLRDILVNKRANLLSFGFLLTIYFSSNGINTLLTAFNRYLKRAWWKKYLLSFSLTLILALLIIIAVVIQVGGEYFMGYFRNSFFFSGGWIIKAIWFFKMLITLLLSITAIDILFFLGSN